MVDAERLNTAYPDESAEYWIAPLAAAPSARLRIEGEYPEARYFSFNAYDAFERPVGAIADFEIDPDPGSSNPFRRKGGRGDRRYTAYVEFSPKPDRPAPNTLYAGRTHEGTPNPAGYLIYRVYVPDDPRDPAGGVPLPRLTLEGADGAAEVPLERCEPQPPPAGGPVTDATRSASYPDAAPRSLPLPPGAKNPPVWNRFFGVSGGGGTFSNEHNAYVTLMISRQYGELLVFRAKAPTFPDTRAGEPATARRELRYSSICQNDQATQRVIQCSPDHQTLVDRDGYFTFVVSDPDDRPANATREAGVNWLPWGGGYARLLIYRHMLPARDFEQAIQNIPEGGSAEEVMGDYYPEAMYCEPAVFEAGGWRSCAGARGAR